MKNHWWRALFIILIFIILMCRYQYKMPKRNFADFHAYYYTGIRVLNNENIYSADDFRKDKIANFKYPPLFALITMLFALTSERFAATIWFMFNFILVILFMHYSGKLIFKDNLKSSQKNWVFFWVLMLTSRFYLRNFDEGQVNIIMMATLLFGIYASYKNKDLLAGFFIGFSILIKYMSAIFIPYFLFKRKFKLIGYILLSLISFSLLPAFFFGWERNLFLQKEFLPYLSKTSLDFYSLSDNANQSLMSAVIRFFSNYGNYSINLTELKDFYLGLLLGAIYVFVFILSILPAKNNEIFRLNRTYNNIDIGLLLICIALFNPNAWIHFFIYLTFGYIVAIFYLFKIKPIDKIVLSLIIISFIFHSFTNYFFTNRWAGDLFRIYSCVTFGALFLFIALLKVKFFPKLETEG